jgi:hypothetical protein
MKFLSVSKDGGPASHVWAYWLFEIKWLFSIVLLKFEDGSRDVYHTHAFNSVSWVLGKGYLRELVLWKSEDGRPMMKYNTYQPGLRPVVTRRTTNHKVVSRGRTWVVSFRGPWSDTWQEYDQNTQQSVTLTHGRKAAP